MIYAKPFRHSKINKEQIKNKVFSINEKNLSISISLSPAPALMAPAEYDFAMLWPMPMLCARYLLFISTLIYVYKHNVDGYKDSS